MLTTCQVEKKKKKISHSKRNALTATSLLPLQKTILFWLFIRLQTFRLPPFSLSAACKRVARSHSSKRLLPDIWPTELRPRSLFRCPKRFLRALAQMAPGASGEQVSGPGGSRVAPTHNSFPLLWVSWGRGNKSGEDLDVVATAAVFSGDTDIKIEEESPSQKDYCVVVAAAYLLVKKFLGAFPLS